MSAGSVTAAIVSVSPDTATSGHFYTSAQNLTVTVHANVTANPGGAAPVLAVWAVPTSGGAAVFLGRTTTSGSGDYAFSGALPQAEGYTLEVFQSPGSSVDLPSFGLLATHDLTVDVAAPTISGLPGGQTDSLDAGGTIDVAGIEVADNNDDILTARLTVGHGTLSAQGPGVVGDGTATLTLSGTAAEINGWLATLKYTTTSTDRTLGNVDDTLTIRVTDQAGNVVASDGTVQIDVTCFCAGTRIRTPAGEVAVETLKPGDLVLTHDGRAVPVRWLGRQTVSTIFGDKRRILPVRIKAGALAEKAPVRDLLVSPDHALLVGGVLVQAGALVNGRSVLRETRTPSVFTYYHVETDEHALILAEGAAAETFVDNVERMRFDNWDEHEALYPNGKPIRELPYPRAKAQRQVPAYLRVMLEQRAAAGEAAA